MQASAAVVEALLRELALFPGHGAVMDEHVDAGAPHVLGDGLRRGPGLAEEQALAARRDLSRVAGELGEAGAVDDEDLPGLRLAGRADDAPGPAGRALHPGEDGLGVAHGRGQPDALDVMPGDARQALDHAHQVGAAVGSGQRVDLVDDHGPQVGEELGLIHPLGKEHDLK